MKGETGVQILLQLWHPGVEILWLQCRNIMAIIRPPNSHRRKYYVHHGTPGNFQYCRLSWGCKTNIFSLSAKTFISSPQMFTPAMGFYSQTCKRAKDLAFHSRPGTLEMNLFLYLFLLTEHFVAEK